MTASFADQEIWHVMIARDDLKRMNVDQLDDAFRLDIVDASTLVWKQGMDKWRRLGSIAGIEDEPETIARPPARPFGPPSAPPPPRPRPVHQPRSVAPSVNPFAATAQPYTAVNPFGATTPYTSNTPAAVFQAPKPAPAQQLFAPDPYAMPKRRVKLDSADLNFHGKSIHWGRWLFAFVLLSAGVLAAYRQNYLREGARKIGLENKYLYGEKQAIGWVTAKAPGAVQAALRQLKLLPGPNAAAPVAALTPAVAAAAPVPQPEAVKASVPSAPPASDPSLKTVSLDSLPVLAAEAEAKPEPAAPTPKARAASPSAPAPKVAAKPAKRAVAEDNEPAPKPAKAKAAPAPEPKPEPKVAKAPPPNMSSPLKAAIWQAMQEDAKKGK